MKKEEFKLEYEKLTDKMAVIHSERIALEKSYIEANKMFNVGDRIFSKKERSFGYVTGFVLNWNKEVKPTAVKEKQDGSKSKISLYIYEAGDVVLSTNS